MSTSTTSAHIATEQSGEVPPNVDQIRQAARDAQPMLEWGDNWDGEGSQGFTQSTLARAQDFLVANSIRLWQACRAVVEAPRILPGPEGSIDLHWQVGDRELLLNVPADQAAPASYFGDSSTGEVVKGSLYMSKSNEWLLLWLTA